MKTVYFIGCASFATVLLLGVFTGRLSAHDGNKHPPQTSRSNTNTPPVSAAVPETTIEQPPAAVSDFANYHPLVVHFPIVLLLVAGVFQILAFFVYRKEFSMVSLLLILAGVISVWLASNIFHAHTTDLTENAGRIFETHELMAEYTFYLSLAALFAKAVSHFFISRKWWSEAIVLLLMLGCSITVAIAGHHGARLVHIEGVGPQGKFLETHQQ